jgi:hypothetical protein
VNAAIPAPGWLGVHERQRGYHRPTVRAARRAAKLALGLCSQSWRASRWPAGWSPIRRLQDGAARVGSGDPVIASTSAPATKQGLADEFNRTTRGCRIRRAT